MVLLLLDDGAGVLTVEPELDDDAFDDEEPDDELAVVVDADAVLDAALALRPAYV